LAFLEPDVARVWHAALGGDLAPPGCVGDRRSGWRARGFVCGRGQWAPRARHGATER
jgi:hypothetical protein